MNEEQLGSMFRDFCTTPTDRILQDTVLQEQPDKVSEQGDRKFLLDSRKERRGSDMDNPGINKVGQMRYELKKDTLNGDDSTLPVEMWDRRV